MPSTDKEVSLAELLRQTGDALLDRTVEVSDGGKVLHLRNDIALREQRQRLMDRRVDPLRALKLHALGALKKHEVTQRGLAERHQHQSDASRKVTRWGRQFRAVEVRSRTDCRQQVLHQRQVQHLLRRHVGDDPPPSANSIEFRGSELFFTVLFEREGSEQVLTHEPVLELSRLAQHVDQRLAMLDQKRSFGRREATPQSYDLSQPSP